MKYEKIIKMLNTFNEEYNYDIVSWNDDTLELDNIYGDFKIEITDDIGFFNLVCKSFSTIHIILKSDNTQLSSMFKTWKVNGDIKITGLNNTNNYFEISSNNKSTTYTFDNSSIDFSNFKCDFTQRIEFQQCSMFNFNKFDFSMNDSSLYFENCTFKDSIVKFNSKIKISSITFSKCDINEIDTTDVSNYFGITIKSCNISNIIAENYTFCTIISNTIPFNMDNRTSDKLSISNTIIYGVTHSDIFNKTIELYRKALELYDNSKQCIIIRGNVYVDVLSNPNIKKNYRYLGKSPLFSQVICSAIISVLNVKFESNLQNLQKTITDRYVDSLCFTGELNKNILFGNDKYLNSNECEILIDFNKSLLFQCDAKYLNHYSIKSVFKVDDNLLGEIEMSDYTLFKNSKLEKLCSIREIEFHWFKKDFYKDSDFACLLKDDIFTSDYNIFAIDEYDGDENSSLTVIFQHQHKKDEITVLEFLA